MKNKKGIVFTTLAIIILIIASGGIVISMFSAINSPIFMTLSSMACHQNAAIRDVMPLRSFLAPMIFCKLYETPVEIDSQNFAACSELNTKGMNQNNREEYLKQCARIQIDDLTDICWQMGGKGKYTLTPRHKDIEWKITMSNIADASTEAFEYVLARNPVTGPSYKIVDGFYETTTGDKIDLYNPPKYLNSGVLRCFRFTIKPRDLFFEDDSFGNSYIHFNNIDSEAGGDGVKGMQKDEDNKTEINPETAILLNYNYTDEHMCYISMYPDVSGVSRSCIKWTVGLDKYAFI